MSELTFAIGARRRAGPIRVAVIALFVASCDADAGRAATADAAARDSSVSAGGSSSGKETGGAPATGDSGAGAGGVVGTGGAPTRGSGGKQGGAGASNGGSGGTVSGGSGGVGTGGAAGAGGAGGSAGTGGAATSSGGSATGGSVSYATNFLLTQSPISEGGAWKHTGSDWTLVNTSNGFAWGTQTGSGAYDDSYAYLSGFPPDQAGSAVIHLASPNPAATHGVEILLRWSDSAHNARGYECNLAWNGAYAEIVRWNGPLGNFTYLDRSSAPSGVRQGDTFSAKIVGNTITSYLNGVQIATATDSTYADGNPGMGFWRGSGAPVTLGDYGFESYSATSVGP